MYNMLISLLWLPTLYVEPKVYLSIFPHFYSASIQCTLHISFNCHATVLHCTAAIVGASLEHFI